MKTSEQISELSTAVAKAALKFPKIERGCTATVYPKDKDKKPYSYDYADLDDVLSAVRGPLAENGVTLSHDAKLIRDPLCLEVSARLEHSSGQFKESEPLPMPLEGTMSLAQQIGSAYTYGRRYTSQGILGISTEADDDGNTAGGHEAEHTRKQAKSACPQCGETKFVYEDRQKGGFFCWKTKGGCGHNWDDLPPLPEPTPEQRAKAAEIAAHVPGVTPADKPAPPTTKTIYQLAVESIVQAKDKRDMVLHKKVENRVREIHKEGKLTDPEFEALANLLADVEVEITRPAKQGELLT